jgi:hypothetical protein
MIGFIAAFFAITITTAQNQCLSETRSIPCWTMSVVFSAVIDSVLISARLRVWSSGEGEGEGEVPVIN